MSGSRLDSNTQLPTNVFKYETFFTNELIEDTEKKDVMLTCVEEFMLLANRHVAEEISRSWKKISLLRRHPPPKAHSKGSLRERPGNSHGFAGEVA